jgi:hypothetical protein
MILSTCITAIISNTNTTHSTTIMPTHPMVRAPTGVTDARAHQHGVYTGSHTMEKVCQKVPNSVRLSNFTIPITTNTNHTHSTTIIPPHPMVRAPTRVTDAQANQHRGSRTGSHTM